MAAVSTPAGRSGERYVGRGFGVAAGIALALATLASPLAAVERPHATLVGLAALAVVLTTVLRLDVALMLLVLTAPLETAFSGGIAGLSLTKVVGALCFASFGFWALRSKRPLYLDRTQVVVIGILFLALVSSLQAEVTGEAFSTAIRYASFAAVFLVLSQLGGWHAAYRRIAWTLTIGCAVASVLALQNYFRANTVVASLVESNPTDFAFILATTLPLSFWLLGRYRKLRPLIVALIGLSGLAIALSLSRSAYVGIAAAIVFTLFTERRHLRIILLGGVLATVAALYVIHTNPQKFQKALTYKEHIASYNVATRFDAWRAAADLAAEHPLLGIGPGNFRFYYNRVTGRPEGTHNVFVVHNAYLDMTAELGFGGVVLFILYLAIVFGRLSTLARAPGNMAGFAQALRVSLLIASVCSIFVSEQYFLPFWLAGGLATALWSERGDVQLAEAAAALGPAPPAHEPGPSAGDQAESGDYDLGVRERQVEERERRVAAQFSAVRAQQEQLRRHRRRTDELERELRERLEGLGAVEADLAARERSLAELQRIHEELAPALQARSLAIEGRERELALGAQELAARARTADETARTLTASEQRLARRAAELTRRESELTAADAAVSAREREVESATRDASQRAKELAARLEALDAREREVTQRLGQLQTERRAIGERRKELTLEERRLARLVKQLDQQSGGLGEQEAQLDRRLERLLAREQDLAAKADEQRERDLTLSRREAELAAREHRLTVDAAVVNARERELERRVGELSPGDGGGQRPDSSA